MATYFFISLAVAIVGMIGAFANVVMAMNHNNLRNTFVLHAIFGLMYALGGLGALITGIIWIVQQFAS